MLNKKSLATAVAVVLAAPLSAYATNGMNLAGYGPIATGMGGASMAYDNGTAAMMNNPATMGLADDGMRLDVALGNLGPDVSASAPDGAGGITSWASEGDSYMMPAIGWSRKAGQLSYGLGVFAQGGMGTEYNLNGMVPSPGAAFAFAPNTPPTSMGGGLAQGSTIASSVMGWNEMSQVGVMRVLVPMNYQVSDNLIIGGSIDYVKASMDIKMAMTGAMMTDMMSTKQIGTLGGTLVQGLQGAMGVSQITKLYGGYFDFADDSDYSGETSGSGISGKLGVVFKLNDQFTLGASYSPKTNISDLIGSAKVSMAVEGDTGFFANAANTGTLADGIVSLTGDISVNNFEWPSSVSLGVAFHANDRLMLVADVKKIAWAEVMKDFSLTFTADSNPMNGGFGGAVMDAVMYQNWDDQTVIQLGASYLVTDALTVRGGINRSSNPIPDATLHYLFPATVENHTTLGLGYDMGGSEINFAYTMAAEASQTNSMSMTVDHSQASWQIMYSKMF